MKEKEAKKAVSARKPKSSVRKTFDLKPKKPLKSKDDPTVKMNKSVVEMLGFKNHS